MRSAFYLVLGACSFQLGSEPGAGVDARDPNDAIDAPVDTDGGADAIGDVAHVPSTVEDAFDATATLMISNAVIDTGGATLMPTIDIALPAGSSLITAAQVGGGPQLAILQIDRLVVSGTLTVRGQRPLVVIAKTSIMVTGAIDASAVKGTPGPGGLGPRSGVGKGQDGTTGSDFNDGGAGGGGFGGPGGAGQVSGDSGAGAGGISYGTPMLVVLEGGSGGGDMSPPGHCANRPAGAGGGSIQLYARDTITINGTVRANGGGGAGAGTAAGALCNGWSVSATGGGSGGAIYIQAGEVSGIGLLLAQGGGGGGGSYYQGSSGGSDGADGPATIAGANGGIGAGGVGGATNDGGKGGYRDGAPSTMSPMSGLYDTGGGGGGGVGRIVIRAGQGTISSSPVAVPVAP